MNKVTLIGNLATDPELRKNRSSVTVCSFRLAVQRKYRSQESREREADFFTVVAWRQLAELCGQYLSKGKKVAVTGSLRSRSYEGKDGVKRYGIDIVAEDIEFLSPRAAETNGNFFDQELPPDHGGCGFQMDDDQPKF